MRFFRLLAEFRFWDFEKPTFIFSFDFGKLTFELKFRPFTFRHLK